MWKFAFVLLLAAMPSFTLAAGLVPCGDTPDNPCQACHVVALVDKLIDYSVALLTIVFTLLVVYAGFGLVTSNGDTGALEKAKKMITNAIIGFMIVLSAWLLMDLILKTLVKDGDQTFGAWNNISCVAQPIANTPPPLPPRIVVPRGDGNTPGGTPGIAGIPTSNPTPAVSSCPTCSSTPASWPPAQMIPNGGGTGIDTVSASLCSDPTGQQCRIAPELMPKLTNFHNAVMSSNISSWWVTEAYPPTGWSSTRPTGIHSHSCFADGSCVKYRYVAGGIAGINGINQVITLAHQYGLLAIYEVQNEAAKDFLVRGGVSANSIQVTGTNVPQFTIYQLAPTSLAGSGNNPVNPDLPGYCGEYYNGVDREVPTDPRFTGSGFTKVEVPFESIWTTPVGIPSPRRALPGEFLNLGDTTSYISIPFIITTEVGQSSQFRLGFIEAAGLEGVITGSVTATISPCPGDFRPRTSGSSDDYLSAQCRKGYGMQFTIGATSNPEYSGCLAPVGKTMYLNISNLNMYSENPITPRCELDGVQRRCGVSVRNL